MKRPDWFPVPPDRLRTEFYLNAKALEDIDGKLWIYLCELIPEGKGSYRSRKQQMLDSIGSGLKVYFLTRGFDFERGSGGLESCMMHDDDDLFLTDTIHSYEKLGARAHAGIIRELQPLAKQRMREMELSDAAGVESDFDDGFWDVWDDRWNQASDSFDFYDVIFADMKGNPDRYTHPKL